MNRFPCSRARERTDPAVPTAGYIPGLHSERGVVATDFVDRRARIAVSGVDHKADLRCRDRRSQAMPAVTLVILFFRHQFPPRRIINVSNPATQFAKSNSSLV